MPSTITWIDHDPIERERALRVLSLFQEKESRDELGLGAIRDSFSDAMFPGTSTIQTRLRYMFFVPWVYMDLEKKCIGPPEFAARARQMELSLVDPLLANSDHAGVFGRVASGSLKRLPSSVYWYGLGTWGIHKTGWSQDEYHRHVDKVYRRRDIVLRRLENDDDPEPETQTWHPRLPDPPDSFPTDVSFELEPDEASFLLDCLLKSQPDSLLTHLALYCQPVECDFPWHHPELKDFSLEHQELVRYAEFFSTLMHGAAFLYNVMLAERACRKQIEEQRRDDLEEWKERLQQCSSMNLPIEELWVVIADKGHAVTRRTRDFITEWHRRVVATGGGVADDSVSRSLVYTRERWLKGARSRFTNSRARDQWQGYAGTTQMTYRWPNISRLLLDLHSGLNGKKHA